MDNPVAEDVVLGGRYRLRALLGAGGMAQVYDGIDERLDRPVAVKLLRPDFAADAGLRQRFELEARAAARLTHPNVVAVFDAGEDQGRSFIVMERLRGESLADAIGHGPLDLAWLRRLAAETLSALGAAHQAGIIHRDIKPANILLGPDGRAKVADFGIARVAEAQAAADPTAALTGTGLVLGTPAYLAPERAMGEPATVRSDLYSVGVVLYEALTGRKPYAGPTPVAIAAAAAQGAAENPYLLRPDADPQLVAVIGRAMALDPAQRYASAAEMAADLGREAPPATALLPVIAPPAMADTVPAATAVAAPSVAPVPAPPRLAPPPPFAGPPREPSGPGRAPWAWALVGVAAVAAIVVALALANSGSSNRASTSPTTGAPAATTATTKPRATATTPPATTATTSPTVVASQSDPMAVALGAWADHLARSKSAAATQLADGLRSVAAADPASRSAPASALLDQTVRWYQQGQLTTVEYAAAAALLHQAGAPQPPSPTVKGKNGGGGGGGD